MIDLASCGSVGGGACSGFIYRGRVRSYERVSLRGPLIPYTRLSPGDATPTSLPDPITATTEWIVRSEKLFELRLRVKEEKRKEKKKT